MRKLKEHNEIFGIEILDREQLTPEIFNEICQELIKIREELKIALDLEMDFFGGLGRLISAWQTILIRDAHDQLAAWAGIRDCVDQEKLYGLTACCVLPEFRRQGIATLLTKTAIKLCWQSNYVVSAQFDIAWTQHSKKALRRACQQLGIPWDNVQKFSDLGGETTRFRIPPRN